MRRAVLNLRDARAAWHIPPSTLQAIATAFPVDWEVAVVRETVDGRGDGSGVSAEALALAPRTEVWIGMGLPVEILRTASPYLRWAHTGTAGVRSLLYPELRDSTVILTNSAGVHAPPMAETAIAMALHFARGIDIAAHAQSAAYWAAPEFENRVGAVFELQNRRCGIIGMGGIGREVAQRALALGMSVQAVRRTDRPAPPGVQLLRGPAALPQLLETSDVVVVAIPSTSITAHLLDANALAHLQPHAILINISRGDVIDENALLELLRQGRIRGAALDVFRTEPLPHDSPFWTLPNALILPHVSAVTTRYWEREAELIIDNIHRYITGRPLRNVVDKPAGY
jgi:phosphoglycerate dehydrogenase-like enzyme